jgi:hypothetical protein
MERTKIMTKRVSIANAAAADTINFENFFPDKDYKFIKGVRINICSTDGTPEGGDHVLIELSNNKGQITDEMHSNGLIFSTSVPDDKRWYKTSVGIDGTGIRCQVKNPVLSTAAYSVLFEFLLTDELVAIGNAN